MDWDSDYIRNLVATMLEQDRAAGSSAAIACFSALLDAQARVLAKDDLLCAGLPLTERVFRRAVPGVQVALFAQDGQAVRCEDCVVELRGDAGAILRAERVAVNALEHLSGIATKTRRFAEEIRGARTRISGPRQAIPGMGSLEQYAIEVGGGIAHPANAILLTSNHVRLAGGVKAALDQAHSLVALQMRPHSMTAYEAVGEQPNEPEADAIAIQIEVQDESELREALEAGADFVILKHLRVEEAHHAVQLVRGIRPDVVVEISEDITLANLRAYTETGADYLCCEGLTHPAPPTRFALLVERREEK